MAYYAQDMAALMWMKTHQGIAFSIEGWLMDGQHRLLAIIASGKSTRMPVWTGVEGKAQVFIDDHARRTAFDAVHIYDGVDKASRVAVQIAGSLLRTSTNAYGYGRSRKTDIIETLTTHQDAILFATEMRTGRRVVRDISMTINFVVYARAFYHMPKNASKLS